MTTKSVSRRKAKPSPSTPAAAPAAPRLPKAIEDRLSELQYRANEFASVLWLIDQDSGCFATSLAHREAEWLASELDTANFASATVGGQS